MQAKEVAVILSLDILESILSEISDLICWQSDSVYTSFGSYLGVIFLAHDLEHMTTNITKLMSKSFFILRLYHINNYTQISGLGGGINIMLM